MRYGFVEEAQRIATAPLEAAQYSDGRLPELFCGFDRERFGQPVPYPTACSPQAWAATAPILLVTSLMRYDAHVSRDGLWLDPVLPEAYGDLHITNAPMAGGRITMDISGSTASVQGLPEGMVLHRGHRPWMTELVEQQGSLAARQPSSATSACHLLLTRAGRRCSSKPAVAVDDGGAFMDQAVSAPVP